MQQHLINGFYKRAAAYGVSAEQAAFLLKKANEWDPDSINGFSRGGFNANVRFSIDDLIAPYVKPGAQPSLQAMQGSFAPAVNLVKQFYNVANKPYLERLYKPNNFTLRQSPEEQNLFNRVVDSLTPTGREEIGSRLQDAITHSPQTHLLAANLSSKLIPNIGRALPIIKSIGAGAGRVGSVANLGIGAFSEAMDAKPGYFQEHMDQQNVPLFGLEHVNAAIQNSSRPAGSIVNTARTLYDIADTGIDIGKGYGKNVMDGSKLMFKKLFR